MTTGTSIRATATRRDVRIEPGRSWATGPAEPTDITPSSTRALDILPTANRRLAGGSSP